MKFNLLLELKSLQQMNRVHIKQRLSTPNDKSKVFFLLFNRITKIEKFDPAD